MKEDNTKQNPSPETKTSPRPKDKSKNLKKILIPAVIALALIGGGIGLFAFLKWYNSPEKVSLDAVSNLISARSITTDGDITLAISEKESPVKSVKLKLNGDSSYLPAKSNVDIELKFKDKREAKFSVGEAITKDGDLYLHFVDVTKGFNGIVRSLVSENPSAVAEINSELAPIRQIITKIDNRWWKISPRELVKELEPSQSDTFTGAYDCATGTISKLGDYSGELVSLYQKHPFVKITPYDVKSDSAFDKSNNYYEYSQDYEQMAGAIHEISDTKLYKDLTSCLENVKGIKKQDISDLKKQLSEVKAKDLGDVSKQKDEYVKIAKNVIGVSKSSRQFSHIYNEITPMDGMKLTTSLHFTYSNAQIQVEAPTENVKNFKELLPLLEGAF